MVIIMMTLIHALAQLFNTLLHIDHTLALAVATYGAWIYALMFLILFCETGLVITPFLPGDSLLFAAGALSATHILEWPLVALCFAAGAICGDNTNYWVGRIAGERLLANPRQKLIRREHLDQTHAYFAHHGKMSIILARFAPIIRTFAPFVAGLGRMQYAIFFTYSVIGTVLWVSICTTAGFFFGNIPVVQNNFSLVVLAIIAVSLIPMLLQWRRARKKIASP